MEDSRNYKEAFENQVKLALNANRKLENERSRRKKIEREYVAEYATIGVVTALIGAAIGAAITFLAFTFNMPT